MKPQTFADQPEVDQAGQTLRRTVRFASGFGCVRCGCTIYRYRRIDGADAAGRAPATADDMVLLCPPCYHALDGKPGAETALATMRDRPLARQTLFDRRRLPYAQALVVPDTLLPSGDIMRSTVVPIMFGGIPILKFGPPEVPGGAIDVSIALGAGDGMPVRVVRSNEWMIEDGGWRFDRPGHRYVVTSRDGVARLVLAIDGPGVFTVEHLRSRAGTRMLEIDANGTRVDGVMVHTPSVRKQLVGIAL